MGRNKCVVPEFHGPEERKFFFCVSFGGSWRSARKGLREGLFFAPLRWNFNAFPGLPDPSYLSGKAALLTI